MKYVADTPTQSDEIIDLKEYINRELQRVEVAFETLCLVTPQQIDLNISSGVIEITGNYHRVDVETGVTDDLDTVNGFEDGRRVVLQAVDSARTVICKDGTGNLKLAGDFSMDNAEDTIELIYSEQIGAWCELSRSNNGA